MCLSNEIISVEFEYKLIEKIKVGEFFGIGTRVYRMTDHYDAEYDERRMAMDMDSGKLLAFGPKDLVAPLECCDDYLEYEKIIK